MIRKSDSRLRLFVAMMVFFLLMSITSISNFAFAEDGDGHGQPVNVKVMSYNIHHAEGVDGILDLERIARVIEDANAEIVGLQEVDNHWSERSDFQDQARQLAERLGMFYTYAANLDRDPLIEGEKRRQYGTAILSKYPILESENHFLSKIGNTEQRGLLHATINVKGNHLEFYNTHLALTSAEREMQIKEIIQITNKSKEPKVLMGDLNATPDSNEMQPINELYVDAFAQYQEKPNTYPVENPTKRIDYIFTSNDIETVNAEVIDTLASDHLPIAAEIVLDRENPYFNGNR